MSLPAALATLRRARWIDLTHAFEPGIPHFAAFPDEERTVVTDLATDGYLTHRYALPGQWGTHVDPPSHFVSGGASLDELPVEQMLLELVVLDARAHVDADPRYAADAALVAEHERAHGPVPSGSFVALRTGWSARWPDAEAMRNGDRSPGWGVDALEVLIEQRGVAAVGHEQTDTDPGALVSQGQVPAEAYVLAQGRWQVELLASLDGVPARGAVILAAWPKPRGGSGFPARCVAIVGG